MAGCGESCWRVGYGAGNNLCYKRPGHHAVSSSSTLVTDSHAFLPDSPASLGHSSVSLGTPVLQSFPIVLIIATIATSALSFLIVKLGPLRYWFGLPPPKDSLLPGKVIRGFLPLAILLVAVIIVYLLQFII